MFFKTLIVTQMSPKLLSPKFSTPSLFLKILIPSFLLLNCYFLFIYLKSFCLQFLITKRCSKFVCSDDLTSINSRHA